MAYRIFTARVKITILALLEWFWRYALLSHEARVLLIEPRANTKMYISVEYLICYTQGGV